MSKPIKLIAHVHTHWAKTNGHTSAFTIFYVVSKGRAPIICADDVSESEARLICSNTLNEHGTYDSFLIISSQIQRWRDYTHMRKLHKATYHNSSDVASLLTKEI